MGAGSLSGCVLGASSWGEALGLHGPHCWEVRLETERGAHLQIVERLQSGAAKTRVWLVGPLRVESVKSWIGFRFELGRTRSESDKKGDANHKQSRGAECEQV